MSSIKSCAVCFALHLVKGDQCRKVQHAHEPAAPLKSFLDVKFGDPYKIADLAHNRALVWLHSLALDFTNSSSGNCEAYCIAKPILSFNISGKSSGIWCKGCLTRLIRAHFAQHLKISSLGTQKQMPHPS
jgi:hypothetical protein